MNFDNHNQLQNNSILRNVQESSPEMLSSKTQVVTEDTHSEPPMTKITKRCHGNRKLQHFKRKCRARGLTEEQIIARVQRRTDAISEQLLTDRAVPERVHERVQQNH